MDYTTSQTATYTASGSLDRDISEIITNITPLETPLLTQFHTGADATELTVEWQTDNLCPPGLNQYPELYNYTFSEVGGIARESNYVQFLKKDGKVSDAMRKVGKVYKPEDELARQKVIKMKEMARDMEYAICKNSTKNIEAGSTRAKMGGIPCFMKPQTISVTFNATTGVVTCTDPHHMLTGDYIVFASGTLPTGLTAGDVYYIRQDTTNPATAFTLYAELEDAAENRNRITFTGTGTAPNYILTNNVIDCSNAAYTEEDLNNAMQMAYMRGGNPTLAVMSPGQKRRFTEILSAVHQTNKNQTDKRLENIISTYETDFGTINAMAHRNYTRTVIDMLDMDMWQIRYFNRPHEVSGLAKTGSFEQFVIEAAFTLQSSQPKASARIMNIKAA